ncbi:MAG: hypothetical protein NZ750_08485 [Anaerolineae bacterium]|nr:hypothetical protein [Anaerolineae bacterium]MDW8172406.1 hypothetical protein [Anaerolineae bacterium]
MRFVPSLSLALTALAGGLLYLTVGGLGFPLDDSWIHQVYGRNLALLGQWAFIPGQPSAASTSPLYTTLLALGYALCLDYAFWTHGLGLLALVGLGLVGARLGQRLAEPLRGVGWWAGLALVTTWHMLWAGTAGMETALFALLTLALVEQTFALLETPTDGRALGWGALAALTTLARPEGSVLALLSGLVLLWGWSGLRWRALALMATCSLLILSPYLALNYSLTGGLLPNTADAKFAQHAPLLALPYGLRWLDLVLAILAGGHVLLVLALPLYMRRVAQRIREDRRAWACLLPLAWTIALVGLYAARLPAAYQHGRYVMPALPALITLGVVGLAWGLHWGRGSLIGRVLGRALALATALSMAYFLFMGAEVRRVDVAIIQSEMIESALWIRDNLPDEALLAAHDIGALGYFAPRSALLDIAGLISPEVIPFVRDGDAMWAWLQDRGAQYLVAFPDQLPHANPADPRLCLLYANPDSMARRVGQAPMAVYRLDWQAQCAP